MREGPCIYDTYFRSRVPISCSKFFLKKVSPNMFHFFFTKSLAGFERGQDLNLSTCLIVSQDDKGEEISHLLPKERKKKREKEKDGV